MWPCGPFDMLKAPREIEGLRLRPAGAGLRSGLALSRPYGLSKPTGAEEPHLFGALFTNAHGS